MKAGVEGSVGSRGAAGPVKGAQLELIAAYAVGAKNDGQEQGLSLAWLGLAWDEIKGKIGEGSEPTLTVMVAWPMAGYSAE
jgi:hypothetical protein